MFLRFFFLEKRKIRRKRKKKTRKHERRRKLSLRDASPSVAPPSAKNQVSLRSTQFFAPSGLAIIFAFVLF
jgi:hypothetical protein